MRVVLVSGPPCAGKTTYITEHRNEGDVVIDFDALAHALGYPTEHVAWPADAHPARTVALRARASAVRAAADVLGDHTTWIVSSNPAAAPRGLPVDEHVRLDPGQDTCMDAAAHRVDTDGVRREIAAWYDAHGDVDTPSRSW